MGTYRPDPYIKPGANLQFLMWLILLGLPALLLFMVFAKDQEAIPPRGGQTHMEQPAGH